jgi:hypothetical protein
LRSFGVLALAICASGWCASCGYDAALESDPNAWRPAAHGPLLGLGGAAGHVDERCAGDPEHDPGLVVSSASALSHRPGEACLGACHGADGEAQTTFEAAGTAYATEGSRVLAGVGRAIHAVGGTRLVVDRCGNFYAVRSRMQARPTSTQPFVNDPTLRKMERAMNRTKDAGNCNQSGCHDFSEKGTSGIFF